MSNKHKFAIFKEGASSFQKNFILKDRDIVSRLSNILKLRVGDTFDLFDKNGFVECKIKSFSDGVGCEVVSYGKNISDTPKLNLFIGLTKKEAFEEILYSATEIGASLIVPVLSQKIHKNWWSEKYLDRFNKIIIAAAEQSKNFCFPELLSPINFKDLINKTDSEKNKILLDVSGANIFDVRNSLKPGDINLLIGPEGDFSDHEKEELKKSGFAPAKLTKNILRSIQAVNVGLGFFRL